jgi:hypothetical protein
MAIIPPRAARHTDGGHHARRASMRDDAMDIAAATGGAHHAMPIKLRDARPIAGRAR